MSKWVKNKKHYVSDLDRLIQEFDQNHEKTPAQKAEINKYQRVHKLRDEPQEEPIVRPYRWNENQLWDDF